jgi:hypothetical protein
MSETFHRNPKLNRERGYLIMGEVECRQSSEGEEVQGELNEQLPDSQIPE